MIIVLLKSIFAAADGRISDLSQLRSAEMRRSNYMRISIRSLFVVTAVIAGAAWWIQWPSRTASNFARDPWEFLVGGRLESPTSFWEHSEFIEFVTRDPDTTPEASRGHVPTIPLGSEMRR
jgi:hypothetical protein